MTLEIYKMCNTNFDFNILIKTTLNHCEMTTSLKGGNFNIGSFNITMFTQLELSQLNKEHNFKYTNIL